MKRKGKRLKDGFFIINTKDDYMGDLFAANENKCSDKDEQEVNYTYFYTQAEDKECEIRNKSSKRWLPNPV